MYVPHVYLPVVKHSSWTVCPATAIWELGEVATNCTGIKFMVVPESEEREREEGRREGGRKGEKEGGRKEGRREKGREEGRKEGGKERERERRREEGRREGGRKGENKVQYLQQPHQWSNQRFN